MKKLFLFYHCFVGTSYTKTTAKGSDLDVRSLSTNFFADKDNWILGFVVLRFQPPGALKVIMNHNLQVVDLGIILYIINHIK